MMKQQSEPVYCGTCGKQDQFYSPIKLDLQDAQLKSEEELKQKMAEAAAEREGLEPFFNEFLTGHDNVEYLVHYCSIECFQRSPDAADISADRKKVVMDWNEKKDFAVSF